MAQGRSLSPSGGGREATDPGFGENVKKTARSCRTFPRSDRHPPRLDSGATVSRAPWFPPSPSFISLLFLSPFSLHLLSISLPSLSLPSLSFFSHSTFFLPSLSLNLLSHLGEAETFSMLSVCLMMVTDTGSVTYTFKVQNVVDSCCPKNARK